MLKSVAGALFVEKWCARRFSVVWCVVVCGFVLCCVEWAPLTLPELLKFHVTQLQPRHPMLSKLQHTAGSKFLKLRTDKISHNHRLSMFGQCLLESYDDCQHESQHNLAYLFVVFVFCVLVLIGPHQEQKPETVTVL